MGNKTGTKAKIELTIHSVKRFGERLGITDPCKMKNMALCAYKNGYKSSTFHGPLHDYIQHKVLSGGKFSVRVYDNVIFIFDNYNSKPKLQTVFPVPEEFVPVEQFMCDFYKFNDGASIIIITKENEENQYIDEYDGLTDKIEEAKEFRTKSKAENYIKNNKIVKRLETIGYKANIMVL